MNQPNNTNNSDKNSNKDNDKNRNRNRNRSRNRSRNRDSDSDRNKNTPPKKESQNKTNNRRRRDYQDRRNKPKKTSNKLSDHFSMNDFKCKEKGTIKISLGLVGALEMLRSKAQKRIEIIKGFEDPEVAEKKGKLKRNFHTQGLAADIKILNLSAKETFLLAEQIPEIMAIGLNVDEDYVHVDTRKTPERLLWVESKNTEIELNQDNRDQYLAITKDAD